MTSLAGWPLICDSQRPCYDDTYIDNLRVEHLPNLQEDSNNKQLVRDSFTASL